MYVNQLYGKILYPYKWLWEMDKEMAKSVFKDVKLLYEDEMLLDDEYDFYGMVETFTHVEQEVVEADNYYSGDDEIERLTLCDPVIYEAERRCRILNRKNRSKKRYPDHLANNFNDLYNNAYNVLCNEFFYTAEYMCIYPMPKKGLHKEIIIDMHSGFHFHEMYTSVFYLFKFIYFLRKAVDYFNNNFGEDVLWPRRS